MVTRASVLSLAVAILVAANHIPGSASLAVMSVDLSSEWLKIALVKPGVPMEIVLNKEARRKTPVMVSIKDGEVLFGDAALAVGTKYPQKAYFYMQHILAKKLDSPAVKTYIKRFPYVQLGEDDERGTVYFKSGEDRYYPEELLAIVLNKSREFAEEFAEQRLKDVVITVPTFFNQAEREAVLYAAELADLKVLQLINDNVAVALNYGVFRLKDFNSTVHNVMFFDMGASSTTATIVTYQVVKTKEKGITQTNPHLFVKGVGFDRTLGGLEMDLRLRDHLAKKFQESGKTKSNVYESPRALAKLFKEAKRLKKVLSANVDHFAQVEGVLDDMDLRTKVTRAELEDMCADLFERIPGTVDMALKASEMTLPEIDSIILVGGGTRVPKVQEKLLEATKKRELAKNINADEAAALGAVYQAAHLSKGFKVKKFVIKDANLYPIQVEFERALVDDDGVETTKVVRRMLFGRNNPFPQKKVMTFNRHKSDFSFVVGYKDLESILPADDLKSFGSANLTTYTLKGVGKALKKRSEAEPKGIKAHFRLDESGLLHLDSVESIFEKTETVMEEVNDTQEEQSTLQKLSSTISRFFSGSSDDEGTTEGKAEDGALEEETADKDTSEKDTSDKEEPAESKEPEPEPEQGETENPDDGTSEGEASETADAKPEEGEDDDGATDDNDEQSTEKLNPDDDGENAEQNEDKEGANDEPEETKEAETDGETEAKEDEKLAGDEEKGKEESGGTDAEGPADEEKTPDETTKDGKGKQTKDSKDTKKKTVAKPKVVTLKENLTVEAVAHGIPKPSREARRESRRKLNELMRREEERLAREVALNSLESFIYDIREKLEEDDYAKCSTEEQREKLREKIVEASDWLDEVEVDTAHSVFEAKLKELRKSTRNLAFRVREMRERPQLIADLKQLMNVSQFFLAAARNASSELQIFTDVEIGLLEKALNDSAAWYAEKSLAQRDTPDTEKPALLTEDLKTKIVSLDRELRYLVNKAKAGPPKKKDKGKGKPKKGKAKSNGTETLGDDVNGKTTKANRTETVEPSEKPSATEAEDGPEVTVATPDSDQSGQEEPLQLPAPDEATNPDEETANEGTPDTEKTDMEEPDVEKPDGEKPDDEKPDEEKPDDEKPDEEKTDEEKPEGEKPDEEKPDDEKPDEEKTDEEKPEGEKPDEEKPDVQEAPTENPTTAKAETNTDTSRNTGDL